MLKVKITPIAKNNQNKKVSIFNPLELLNRELLKPNGLKHLI